MTKLFIPAAITAVLMLSAAPVAADPGGGPHVRVFSGNGGGSAAGLLLPAIQSARETMRRSGSFNPYGSFQGGVRVGTGDITDGTSNTMMLGERNYPGGLPGAGSANFAMGDGSVHTARSGNGSRHIGGANVLFGDGSVRTARPGYRNSFQCIPASCGTGPQTPGSTMPADSWESPGG